MPPKKRKNSENPDNALIPSQGISPKKQKTENEADKEPNKENAAPNNTPRGKFEALPSELFANVISHLSHKDLRNLSATSKQIQQDTKETLDNTDPPASKRERLNPPPAPKKRR